MFHTLKNIKITFLAVLLRKSFVFNNLKVYDSHVTIKEIGKFDVKISVIPNGLEKYMAFTVNKNLLFIDSKQFMNSNLD